MNEISDSLPAMIAAMDGVGELRVAIPETWLQGRTACGGLSAALALAAVLRRWDDLPALRSAQIAFIGPLAGEVIIRTELLRRGRSAAFAQADLLSDGALGFRATFVFMSGRESHVDFAPAPLDALPPIGEPLAVPPAVAFAQNFEIRRAGVEARGTGRFVRWARLREREGLHPMVELMAIGDVLPPAAMSLFATMGPVSSMSWQINLLTSTPATEDGWWLVDAAADHAQEGVSAQQMQIRSSDGTLIATGGQCVALFV